MLTAFWFEITFLLASASLEYYCDLIIKQLKITKALDYIC